MIMHVYRRLIRIPPLKIIARQGPGDIYLLLVTSGHLRVRF